jgi:hypothetical protein
MPYLLMVRFEDEFHLELLEESELTARLNEELTDVCLVTDKQAAVKLLQDIADWPSNTAAIFEVKLVVPTIEWSLP